MHKQDVVQDEFVPKVGALVRTDDLGEGFLQPHLKSFGIDLVAYI